MPNLIFWIVDFSDSHYHLLVKRHDPFAAVVADPPG